MKFCWQLTSRVLPFVAVDECATGSHGCDQLCTDTCEAYECNCGSGYRLLNDNSTCEGIQIVYVHCTKYINLDICELQEKGCNAEAAQSILSN